MNPRRVARALLTGVVAMGLTVHPAGQAPPLYTAIEIGVSPGVSPAITAVALNAAGQVIGRRFDAATNSWRDFIFQNGVTTDISFPSGFSPVGLNNFGLVAGIADGAFSGCSGFGRSNGAAVYSLWSGLESFVPGVSKHATSVVVNDAGQVTWNAIPVCGVSPLVPVSHALSFGVVGDSTGTTSFGVNPSPFAINQAGHVLASDVSSNYYLVSGGLLIPLGGFTPTGLNDLPQITGYRKAADGRDHGVIWSNGVLTDIGTGRLWALNNFGQAVGTDPDADGNANAFVYQKGVRTNLSAVTLVPRFWSVNAAAGINDSGWILADAKPCPTCGPRSVLLTPTTPAAPAITVHPEDQSVSLGAASPAATFTALANAIPSVCRRLRTAVP